MASSRDTFHIRQWAPDCLITNDDLPKACNHKKKFPLIFHYFTQDTWGSFFFFLEGAISFHASHVERERGLWTKPLIVTPKSMIMRYDKKFKDTTNYNSCHFPYAHEERDVN